MATHEPADGMAQEVERQLQLAITAATLAARKAVAHRQASLNQARADSDARAANLRAQLDRERILASDRIQPVFDSAWWDNATPAQVAEMWQQTAHTWPTATNRISPLPAERQTDRPDSTDPAPASHCATSQKRGCEGSASESVLHEVAGRGGMRRRRQRQASARRAVARLYRALVRAGSTCR
jgi:hypothetical protein